MSAYHHTVPPRAIIPDAAKSLNSQKDDNLIIHGDNLHALKALLPKYAGRVNCIYIDPPYNTGNEGWVYNDNVSSPILKEWLGDVVGSDDMERHSKWCCMMWPRLQLLRELLAEDGVIFVSIDDNEQHRLRMMMDEIFMEKNFYAFVSWTARNKPMNAGQAKYKIQKSEEYILVYGKIPMDKHPPFKLEEREVREYPHNDGEKDYRWEEVQQRKNTGIKRSDRMVFSILDTMPQTGYRWTIGRDTADTLVSQKHIKLVDGKIRQKRFRDEEDNASFNPFWANLMDTVGSSESGKSQLDSIIPGHGLETVKPVELIRKILFHATEKKSIVLDSFAGSGTTAHAVLALNKEDGGNRKFILVECEEYTDTTTAERVRRVIRGVPDAESESLREGTGGSFTFCTLGKAIDAEKMLGNKDFPDYPTLAAYLLYLDGTTVGGKLHPNGQGMFHHTDDTDYYLLYKPDQKFMMSSKARLGTKRALAISNRGRRAVVFAADSEMGDDDLRQLNIELVRLPYVLERAR